MAALNEAEPGTALQLPDGSQALVEHTSPGVRAVEVVQADGRNWRLRLFEPGSSRPAFYPADLPFVAGCKTAITEGADGHLMATWETADVGPVAAQVSADTKAAGWEPQAADSALARLQGPMQLSQFKRGTQTRVIMRMSAHGASLVTLFDS